MKNSSSRRSTLKKIAGGAALTGLYSIAGQIQAAEKMLDNPLKGRINHSVCKWCFNDIPLETFCKTAKEIGIRSIELLGPNDWATLKKYDLHCAMPNGAEIGLDKGWSDTQYHEQLIKNYHNTIPLVAKAGLSNLITFSGNRKGMDDETGLKNCAEGLKKIMKVAEQNKVTVVMELLNSRVNHPDYFCDHTEWGVELCKRVGSENFKLLYDIYHMQVMEGDVIATIKKHHQYIAHYHTAGVPGRNEIDESQELNYPAIMKAIVETGYKGWVAQEFIPKRDDKIGSLKQGIMICDV
jgi:hydroxypyruvate isomerase